MPSQPITLALLRGVDEPTPVQKASTLYFVAHTTQAEKVAFDLQFLHRVRDLRWLAQWPDWATSQEAVSYYRQLPTAAAALLEAIGTLRVDLIMSAPSRRRDAEPYVAFVKQRFPDATDLSRCVHRVRDVSAGARPDPIRFTASIALTCGSLAAFRDVLIVDDVFSSGTTASAITTRLEQFGLAHDAQVSVAAPLLARPDEAFRPPGHAAEPGRSAAYTRP